MIALILATPGAASWVIEDVQVPTPIRPKLRLVGGTDMAKSALDVQIEQIAARRAAAAPGQTEFTVAQFCKQRGLELTLSQMQSLGRAAAKFSREAGLQIGRAVDELFGEVNAYCIEALEAVMGKFAVVIEARA